MKPQRPILRYHGGKWMLADWIISNFPPHRVYVEPFGGAASVLLQKERSYSEVYNDLSGELVNLFRVVRDRGFELVEKLRLTPFARDEYRLSFEVSSDDLEQARRTVIRSFMGFGSNSLCRSIQSGFRGNSNRSGTTPAHDWANLPEAYKPLIERLRGVVIENRDALDLIGNHGKGGTTLIYADPPYVHSTRSEKVHGHHGYDFEMTDDQHREVAHVLRSVDAMVVLSGYRSELYDELYSDWSFTDRDSHADGARDRVERLWFNARAAECLSQKLLDFSGVEQ
jgi:DNA adenine methylase